jgi:UPF0755 protein
VIANIRNVHFSTKKAVIRFLMIIVFLGLGLIGGAGLYISNALLPVEGSEHEVRFVIPKGMDSGKIAGILERHGLIRSSVVFKYYLRYKNEGAKFQAGEYAMNPGITLDQIIMKLNRGETVAEETIRFTVPEGFTFLQIVQSLSDKEIVDRNKFAAAAEDFKLLESTAIANIPDDPSLKFRLEGYLFPETYEMKKASTERDILNRMLQELEKKLKLLPAGWQEQLNARGIDFHQMMTIASLIEREVVIEEERTIVAGVIYNRLKQNMHLQIDATVQYIFEEQKERLLYEDLKVESPYNTYLHAGLPPGPIASPSLASIQAAIYPQETKYLFYVTKKDGTQGHLFAETFAEHKRNIAKSEKNGTEKR